MLRGITLRFPVTHPQTRFASGTATSAGILTALLLSGCQWNMQAPAPSTALSQPVSSSLADIDSSDSANAEATAQRLFASFQQWRLEQNPILASQRAVPVATPWPDLSRTANDARARWLSTLSDHLQALDLRALTPSTALHVRALNLRIEALQAAQDCNAVTPPFGRQDDWHHQIIHPLRHHQPVDTVTDFYRYLKRMEHSAVLLRQWQGQIDQAGSRGVMPPIANRQQLVTELNAWLDGFPFSDSSAPSLLWEDIQRKIARLKLHPKPKPILEKQPKAVLTNSLLPTLRQLKAAVAYSTTNNKVPSAEDRLLHQQCYSETLALMGAVMPEPATDKTPNSPAATATAVKPADNVAEHLNRQAMHRIGELETELTLLLQLDAGEAFAPQLRAWMASHQPRPDNLLEDSRERLTALNQRLPEQFAQLPATTLVVSPATAQQGYIAAVAAIEQPAFFYVPASGAIVADNDPLAQWPSALYQQSLPGKHLQLALAMENPNLPRFMATPGDSQFAAGWPLLSAELATRMDGYRSNDEQAGVLISELNAQLNLALDTATHQLSQNSDQRLTVCLTHSPLGRDHCTRRLNQIETNPGMYSAEAVSLSQLRTLRSQARNMAGQNFDEPAFYSDLLASGALPAELYSDWLKIWIKSQK